MKEVTITQEQITEAFKKAKGNETVTQVLTALFGEQKTDYSDYRNIKTYEDACEALGVSPINCIYISSTNGEYYSLDEEKYKADIAYMKLCTIAKALNNDPDFPRFTADESRYYPYFYLYNQKKIDEMNEDERKELVLWGGHTDDGAYCGIGFAASSSAWSYATASIGSLLAVKSSEIAEYFGKQFKELWKDYLIGK